MFKRSLLFAREPTWFEDRKGSSRKIPKKARSWLYEPGSLTRRLRLACGPAFRVRLLHQRWARPFLGESRVLHLPYDRNALIREVVLQRDHEPLVLARTVMPAKTLDGAQRSLSRLGNRSLGEVLFSYPGLERFSLQLTKTDPADWAEGILLHGDGGLCSPLGSAGGCPDSFPANVWGRRTLYAIAGRRLLVCEFFLPTVFSLRERLHEAQPYER